MIGANSPEPREARIRTTALRGPRHEEHDKGLSRNQAALRETSYRARVFFLTPWASVCGTLFAR